MVNGYTQVQRMILRDIEKRESERFTSDIYRKRHMQLIFTKVYRIIKEWHFNSTLRQVRITIYRAFI